MARASSWRTTSAVVALFGVVAVGGCTDTAPQPVGDATSVLQEQQNAAAEILQRDEEIAAVLRERAAAIVAGDREAYTAGIDATATDFLARQQVVFASMSALRFGSFDYGTPEPAPGLAPDRITALGPDATVVRLHPTYTLAGFDRSPRGFETYLTFVRRGDTWLIADDTDGGTQPQLWDLAGLRTVSSTTTLVAGNASEAILRDYLALGDAAVAEVSAVWPRPWGDRLVLVVPRTRAEMAGQLLRTEADVTQVAAVTDGTTGLDGTTGADRIVVNPEAFGRLRSDGRRVVITHETTHVAVRRTTTGPVPIWLSEGYADYVGYGAVDVARTTVASQLLEKVRSGAGPTALPTESDFDPGQSTIAPSYNAAYLAVSRLADEFGADAVARLYVAAGTRRDPPVTPDLALSDAMSSVLGTTVPAFTDDWLGYLQDLAG